VKSALRVAQNDKCAFCESKITHIGYGDIEHFRPKGGVRQHETEPLKYPGYYWLVYEWDNLFLSCQLCNQRFKRNCFPLRNPKQRVRTHRGTLSRESPLLVCPADPPDLHITFVNELAVPSNGSEMGRVTIDLLGLNRDELLQRRRDRRIVLLTLRNAYKTLSRDSGDHPSQKIQFQLRHLELLLDEAISDSAEYAAMARITLRSFHL
jgi:uncharacterized protein (TIGR02646 family)